MQKIGKKYVFHGKLLLNLSLGLSTLQNVNLYLFYASEQTKVLKKVTSCISHSRCIFTHIQVGGGWVAVGGRGKAAKQGKSPFTAKIRPFIHQLLASQTSEHFLLEIKDVAF